MDESKKKNACKIILPNGNYAELRILVFNGHNSFYFFPEISKIVNSWRSVVVPLCI